MYPIEKIFEMGSASELTVATRGMRHILHHLQQLFTLKRNSFDTIYNNYLKFNIISLTPFTTTITKSCLQSVKTHFTQTQRHH